MLPEFFKNFLKFLRAYFARYKNKHKFKTKGKT